MKEGQVSGTALATTYCRGYHAQHDAPIIFDDNLAYSFLTEEERTFIEQFFLQSLQSNDPVRAASFSDRATALSWLMQTNASVPISLCRNQYAEEKLEAAVKQGVQQYVNLGAGMDTFAFRRPEMLEKIKVFEVDHPATQNFKRQRLKDLGWQLPEQLHFIPVDFARESLSTALTRSPYDPNALSLLGWMGVAMYLTPEDVYSTMQDIIAVAHSSSIIIFDYLDNEAFIPQKAAPRVYGMIDALRQMGEPLLHKGIDPLSITSELNRIGLLLHEDLSPLDMERRYFMGRTDYYSATEHAHIACVGVK